MPTVLKLIGPTKTERLRHRIAWSFIGIVSGVGGEAVCRWKLYFYFDRRRYVCLPRELIHGDEKLAHEAIFDFGRLETPLTGKMTPMLRSRLKPEHIAEATRLALNFKGRT